MASAILWQSLTHENAERNELIRTNLRSIAQSLWWNVGLFVVLLLEHNLCLVARHFISQHEQTKFVELMLCRCGLVILVGNACILFLRYFSLRHKLKQSCISSPAASVTRKDKSLVGERALLKTVYFPSMHLSRPTPLSTSNLGSPLSPGAATTSAVTAAASSSPKMFLDKDKSWLQEAAPRYASSPTFSPYTPNSNSPPLSSSMTPPSFLGLDSSSPSSRDFGLLPEFSLSTSAFGVFPYSPNQPPVLRSTAEYSPLRQNAYQLATSDPTPSKFLLGLDTSSGAVDLRKNSSSTGGSGGGGASGQSTNLRVSLSQAELELATERLRRWLHGTVLCRLVAEIDSINAKLGDLGHDEMRIGEARIDTLRQLAQRPQALYFPTLAGLIPFLDCTTHQAYLVQRLRELALGGAMGVYRWNAGSCESEVQPWREHLPPDASLIVHLFASYMDARLPAHPRCPEGRSFSSLHLLRMGDKCDWHGQRQLSIRQTAERPPHFNLLLGGTESQELEVAHGNRNAFYVILLFLQELVMSHDGYLHGINLGPSGLNILWVLHGEENNV